MFLLKRFSIICVLLLSFGPMVWSQTLPTPPAVYVSGGASIYSVTVVNGNPVVAQIFTSSNANFESLAIGPDNADTTAPGNGLAAGNALHPVLLYACDTAGKTVIRFDPGNPSVRQLVYSGGGTQITPVCGRSTSTGDFYVTDKVGGGVFKLSGSNSTALANVAFPTTTTTTAFATASSVSASPAAPRAITQKYTGDPLVVDNGNNKVLRAAFAGLATNSLSFSPFISSAIFSSLTGIARISTGEVFVSNGILKVGQTSFPPVAHFNRDAGAASACSVLNFSENTNELPVYLATTPVANSSKTAVTDTVYLVTSANSKGTLWSWNTSQAPGNCSLSPVATVSNSLSGIAVAPAPVTLNLQVSSSTTNPTETRFNFNSHQFWLTADGCMATATAYPLIPATVSAMVSLAGVAAFPNGATPIPNLGEQGYEIAYVAHWLSPAVTPQCVSVFTDGFFEKGIFGFYDASQYTNPRIVYCDNGDPGAYTQANEPQLRTDIISGVSGPTSCAASDTVAVFPIGGPIPGDFGTVTRNSFYAPVNSGLSTAEPGQFCGFMSPLTNTTDPSKAPTPTGNAINVRFKLATPGNCKNGPYISDASALISVARICNTTPSNDSTCGPKGASVFDAIRVNPNAASLDEPPLFNSGNNQYSFSLSISALASGTYSLTVTFLTNNQASVTTYFKH
jgi:hypothetical protein